MSMMIHRKREALRLREQARRMQTSESSTPVMTGAVVEDTAPVVDNVEEGKDITSPAPDKERQKEEGVICL